MALNIAARERPDWFMYWGRVRSSGWYHAISLGFSETTE